MTRLRAGRILDVKRGTLNLKLFMGEREEGMSAASSQSKRVLVVGMGVSGRAVCELL